MVWSVLLGGSGSRDPAACMKETSCVFIYARGKTCSRVRQTVFLGWSKARFDAYGRSQWQFPCAFSSTTPAFQELV